MNDKKTCNCPLCNQQFTPADGLTAAEHLARGIIRVYAETQKKEDMPCPRCGRRTMAENVNRNALSRHEAVMVCDACGTEEALRVHNGTVISISDWWAVREILGLGNQ